MANISIYHVKIHLLFFTARINHDCSPNCRKFFSSDKSQGGKGYITMIVKAARYIEPGEELTISYTPPLFNTTVRQVILTQTKVSGDELDIIFICVVIISLQRRLFFHLIFHCSAKPRISYVAASGVWIPRNSDLVFLALSVEIATIITVPCLKKIRT